VEWEKKREGKENERLEEEGKVEAVVPLIFPARVPPCS